jgi:hypothetical protein
MPEYVRNWMSVQAPAARQPPEIPVLVASLTAIGVCVLGLFGVLLDWVTVETGFGSIGRKGIDTDDGKLALAVVLLALIAALFAAIFRSRGWFLVLGILGAAALGIAIYDGRDVSHRVGDLNSSVAAAIAHATVGR